MGSFCTVSSKRIERWRSTWYYLTKGIEVSELLSKG